MANGVDWPAIPAFDPARAFPPLVCSECKFQPDGPAHEVFGTKCSWCDEGTFEYDKSALVYSKTRGQLLEQREGKVATRDGAPRLKGAARTRKTK